MKNLLTIAFLFLFVNLFAQRHAEHPAELVSIFETNTDFVELDLFTENTSRHNLDLPEALEDYSILDLNSSVIQNLRSNTPEGLSFMIQSGSDRLRIQVVKSEIYSDNFTVTRASDGTIVDMSELQLPDHYRGVVEGVDGSVVAISISDNEVSGLISMPERLGNLVLGKIENTSSHILYQDIQLSEEFAFHCQVPPNEGQENIKHQVQQRVTTNCVEIHIDLGNDIVTGKGGVVPATNYMTNVFNQVAILYANDNIDIALASIVAWDTAEPFDGLNNFGSYRNSNPVTGDLNAYVNYAFGGGVAWLNGLCGSNKYSVSGITPSFNNVPTYSWSVEVFAHEIGHNAGSPHTHACFWNGDNTAIDGCGANAGYSEGCDGDNPSGGGTIMSYCHLTSVGINFSLGFGPQPTARISNYIDSRPCLSSCVAPTCDDGTQNGQETGIDCGGPDCAECPPCPDNEVTLTIVFDQYSTETSFDITDDSGATVASGGNFGQGSGSSLDFVYCLPDGCYDFTISDSFGDGICCGFGNGSYTLVNSSGGVLVSGGEFTFSETTEFCLNQGPEVDCSVFDTAPVDLNKSFQPVNGIQDRVQVKFYKASPAVRYASEDSAACDIKFWKKRFLDEETGNVYGDPIQNPDTTVLSKVQKNNNNPLFKWPVKFRADGANNANRVDQNYRYEWQVRCYCQKGDGPVSPWSDIKIFNTPNFDPATGIYTGGAIIDSEDSETKGLVQTMRVDLFPNPSEGGITATFKTRKGESNTITVFDMYGKLVFQEQVIGSGSFLQVDLDLSHLNAGNYLVNLVNEHNVVTNRLMLTD